ncbi:MAG TPA: FkbM family methyltransferase [Solirubrobacterales bacterium]|nr:FkbM family methyltransferase [Solirubrobacterales bacterium]
MKARDRFAPRRLVLVAMDIGRRTARRLGIPIPLGVSEPGPAFRRSMSRATPPRGPLHRRLQKRYRAHRIRRFLAPAARRGQLAFDLGANVGEWSAVLRSLGSRVVAVEPQAECVAVMQRRFAADPDVATVRAAVADWIGTGELRPSTTSSTHASMSTDWRRIAMEKGYMPPEVWLEPIEVPVVTLDSLIDSHGVPSYCKIDVEGFEPQALRGLSHPIATIDFEFHRELADAVEDCLERLADLGDYRYRTFIGEWPEVRGGELARGAVPDAIAALEPGTWGMIRASSP